MEIEKMLELDGLKYISTPRQPNKKGVSYGGAAIIVNTEKFTLEKLNVHIPHNLEVVWGLMKSKNPSAKFKKIITCSFYSPPSKKRNTKMADHIVSTLQMLTSIYPESGIILGADRNYMDIKPILTCGLKLRQVVDKSTRKGSILDIIIMNMSSFYNSPIIAPPIAPDDPMKGKASDHWVPVCTPHTDRFNPPRRNYRIINYRPLPESGIMRFGEWIVSEDWNFIESTMTPCQQVTVFEGILMEKLNKYCPVKSMKISSQDKAWITKDLKILKRKKSREYTKRGKSEKYNDLSKLFKEKYKIEAGKYLRRNMDELMESRPGQAYKILKRMGAQPGDGDDINFTLSTHESENLSPQESAERIATYFSTISQEFSPLTTQNLPDRVLDRLASKQAPPTISEYDTYIKIKAAKKPQSGVPGDLPQPILKEFMPELAAPVSKIINNIFQTCQWPTQWKLEYVTPIGKTPHPETEDDLRPISLTNFFSKVTEHFVVMWLLKYVGDKIDFRQYGGMKGNSTTHYLIEFIKGGRNWKISNGMRT